MRSKLIEGIVAASIGLGACRDTGPVLRDLEPESIRNDVGCILEKNYRRVKSGSQVDNSETLEAKKELERLERFALAVLNHLENVKKSSQSGPSEDLIMDVNAAVQVSKYILEGAKMLRENSEINLIPGGNEMIESYINFATESIEIATLTLETGAYPERYQSINPKSK